MEGIIEFNNKDEEIANFLIDDGYRNFNVTPLCCIKADEKVYGLNTQNLKKSEYVAIHIMDTIECLEHPNYQKPLQIIRRNFDKRDITQLNDDENILLESLEIWEFITSYINGSINSYELLYLPAIHCDSEAELLFSLMREGISNNIAKSSYKIAYQWLGNKNNITKAVIAYYRMIQSLLFLKDLEFEWEVDNLIDYIKCNKSIRYGIDIINKYKNQEKNVKLDKDKIRQELEILVDEVKKAKIVSILPDRVPEEIIEIILRRVKKTRISMI